MITRFEDGQEALEALCPETEEPQVRPDIILLDLNLPRSDGIDVLRQIRLTPGLAGIPVAILTSSESPSDRRNASQLGADRYILKPAQLDEFLTQVSSEVKELLLAREMLVEHP